MWYKLQHLDIIYIYKKHIAAHFSNVWKVSLTMIYRKAKFLYHS